MMPWDYSPDLTRDRLILVAQLLARGRGHALDRFDPHVGDDKWTLGVCAFNYGRFEVRRLAGASGFEWLSVPDPRRRFVFQMGQTRLRFYRGDAEVPNANMLVPTELEQYTLPFETGVSLDGVTFRFAIDTDRDGTIIQIALVVIRNGAPELVWRIPYESAAPLIVGIADDLPEAVELEAAEFGFVDDDEGEQDDESGTAKG